MKKLLFLLLPIAAMILNSCSKDEGEDDNGNGTGTSTTKLVKQLSKSDGQTYYFEYDNEKRTNKVSVIGTGYSYSANITYSDNTITVNGEESNGGEWMALYTLNSDGYVTKYDYSTDSQLNDSETYTYSGGNWTKSAGEAWFGDITLKWQNGNIVQVTRDDDNSDAYTYNDKEDKMNIVVCDINDDIADGVFPFFISRFKGMTSRNLMSMKDYSSSNEQRVFTFEYILDADGYPTEIVSKLNGERHETITIYYY